MSVHKLDNEYPVVINARKLINVKNVHEFSQVMWGLNFTMTNNMNTFKEISIDLKIYK